MWDKIRLRINFWTYRLWNTFWVILIPVSVIWYGIKDAISNNFSRFDFGGAGSPDKSYGVRDFKKKFGGKEVFYGRFQKNHKPNRKQQS